MTEFPWNLVWILVNLALIFYLARRFLSKPVGSFLDKRRQDIDRRFSEAEEEVQTAARLRREAGARLEGVEQEKSELLGQARQRMERVMEETRDEAEREGARITERTRTGISRERDVTVRRLWQEASGLTVRATGTLLPRVLSPDDDRRLMEEVLSGLKEVDV